MYLPNAKKYPSSGYIHARNYEKLFTHHQL